MEPSACSPDERLTVVAYTDEPLRLVVYRMAETGFTRMPVIDKNSGGKLAGLISLDDLLRARTRNLTEERQRERVLRIRLPFGASESEEAVPGQEVLADRDRL